LPHFLVYYKAYIVGCQQAYTPSSVEAADIDERRRDTDSAERNPLYNCGTADCCHQCDCLYLLQNWRSRLLRPLRTAIYVTPCTPSGARACPSSRAGTACVFLCYDILVNLVIVFAI